MAQRPKLQMKIGLGASAQPGRSADLELVERVRAGHTDAFAQLVEKYQDRVFNTCWRIVGHLEDARDLTQEAFFRAFQSLATFRAESGFYTWVFRVAVNLALSHRRSAKRRREVSYDRADGTDGTQAEGLARHLGHRGVAGEAPSEAAMSQRVVRALSALDDDHRAVVVLRDIEGFDYHEIAVILEIAPGTVKSRLHRARTELRRMLSGAESDR